MATRRTVRRLAPVPVSKAKNAFDLLTDIRKIILAEPLRYDQTDTLTRLTAEEVRERAAAPRCGTIGCVAGWTVTLKGRVNDEDVVVTVEAQEILGLDEAQSDDLFNGDAANDENGGEPGSRAHAEAGARHIQRFQDEHKDQLKAKRV